MKKILACILLLSVTIANAQTKDEKTLIDKTYLLSNTVFGTKDSLTLESLFAATATYGHSHGKLQTRKEAIDGIAHNQSVYTDTSIASIKVLIEGNTAIVRYLYKAKENKKDGTIVSLNFTMMLVWIKEDNNWKLFGRQAVSLD
ncbi:nuclear transport factor 2 family protein [Ferruginibacter albus]|uniref:nuclear transport factor 2 family protein n=1 Tax=Ferruginibacter albus TaxID=2875540 RepID=UPI001CC6BD75|nr:nuclear transport factor 2 family protein [Ferruginibacter albus]UAY51580.1 nuclear transport factor 2 family protein [Ferruginibacter albus]